MAKVSVAGIAMCLCAALAGCNSGTKTHAPEIAVGTALAAEQVLNRQIEGTPQSLDPSIATDVPSEHVLDDLFEGLVTVNEAGEPAPGVAKSWQESRDGLTWTFHLRDDARWSNGMPVTAKDFVYAWQRTLNPDTASEDAQMLAPIVNALAINAGKLPADKLGVDTPDPHTLIVHLVHPTPYILSLLSNDYLDPEYPPAIRKWGQAWTLPGHLVSDGAFMLVSEVINGRIVLVKNPYYWDARAVRLTKVTYFPLSNFASAVSQYLAGNLDWTNSFTADDATHLEQTLGAQVVHAPYVGTGMLGFNMKRAPFKGNRKLRLAMSMAVDRKILAKYISHGLVRPAYQLIPPLKGYAPAVPKWATLAPKARHALALKLYHEAGYSKAHPLRVTLTFASGGAGTRRYMEALQAMWRMNLGADVTINTMQWKVLLQSLEQRALPLFWDGWIADYPDPYTFMQLFTIGFPQNDGDFHSPEFDALVNEAQHTVNPAQRYAIFTQAEKLLNRNAAYLPLYFYETAHLVKPYVKGWKSNDTDRNMSRYMYILKHHAR